MQCTQEGVNVVIAQQAKQRAASFKNVVSLWVVHERPNIQLLLTFLSNKNPVPKKSKSRKKSCASHFYRKLFG